MRRVDRLTLGSAVPAPPHHKEFSFPSDRLRIDEETTDAFKLPPEAHSSPLRIRGRGEKKSRSDPEMWDLTQRSESVPLKGHIAPVQGLAFSPKGDLLASAGEDYRVGIWETATGKKLHLLQGHKQSVEAIAFSPDGGVLAAASYDKTVKLWDVHTGQEILTLNEHRLYVLCVTFSSDGRFLATGGDDLDVRLWQAALPE